LKQTKRPLSRTWSRELKKDAALLFNKYRSHFERSLGNFFGGGRGGVGFSKEGKRSSNFCNTNIQNIEANKKVNIEQKFNNNDQEHNHGKQHDHAKWEDK